MSTESKRGVIDRFEDSWAVIFLEDQTEPINIERSQLPPQAKGGDHIQLLIEDDTVVSITIDDEATNTARARILAKVERLRRGEHLRPPESLDDDGDRSSVDADE